MMQWEYPLVLHGFFRPNFINRFKGRLVNVHSTRLPANRGGGGFSWRILKDDRLGACQIHLIDHGIDTGVILKSRKFEYPSTCRIPVEFHQLTIQQLHPFFG